MKRKYFALQLCRAKRLLPSVLLAASITLFGIGLAAASLLHANTNGEAQKKVGIGIVGDISDTYLGVGIYALQNMDSSRFSIAFLEMEEAEAARALAAREIEGYVRVPADFISGIVSGENVPATFVMRGGPEGFGTILTSEITGAVSGLVTETQKALYALQDLARDAGQTEGIWDKVKTLNIEYIEMILGRHEAYRVETIGFSDAVSFGGYYIAGLYAFALLLWGIAASRFFIGRRREAERLLAARGIGGGVQVLSEYAAFLCATVFAVLLFALPLGAVVSRYDFGIRELFGAGFFSPIAFVLWSLPVMVLFSAMQFFLYEVTRSTIGAILLQFLTAIGLGYISGCFYPITFFPAVVQRIGAATPVGIGLSHLRSGLAGTGAVQVGAMLVYTAAFLVLAAKIRTRSLSGDVR